MNSPPWRIYDVRSKLFFDKYEELSFSKVHRSFLQFLPKKGANCLDVGSGSGRDALALAKRGFRVVAVEPSQAMRELAAAHHPHPNILWIDDHLPHLEKVKRLEETFSFILVSAVWMHVSPNDRDLALSTLSSMLSESGYIGFTLRMGPDSERRMMFTVTVQELIDQAAKLCLYPAYISRAVKDGMDRHEVKWKKVVFSKKCH